VLLLGAALWWLFSGGVSSDFELVPHDAQAFATVRVADLLETPFGKKTLDSLGAKAGAVLGDVEHETGLTPRDIDRLTLLVLNLDAKVYAAIVQTRKPYDRAKVLKPERNPREAEYAGRKYYQLGGDAIYFHTDRVVVFGTEEGVKRALDPKKAKSGPLSDSLTLASKSRYQVVTGGSVPQNRLQELRRTGEPFTKQFAALFEVQTAHLALAVKDDVAWEVGLTFADKTRAKEGEEALKKGLSLARTMLPLLEMTRKPQGENQMNEMLSLAGKELDKIEVKQSGAVVTLSGRTEGSTLLTLLGGGLVEVLPSGNDEAKENAAKLQLKILTQACETYKLNNGDFPPPSRPSRHHSLMGGRP
jgi:hypothetical protein